MVAGVAGWPIRGIQFDLPLVSTHSNVRFEAFLSARVDEGHVVPTDIRFADYLLSVYEDIESVHVVGKISSKRTPCSVR
ncbi:hypothetical protein [Haloprofundus halophilus]|uniref:hypothetical protein n=1 Tax=Haloprofundus halophilus TaxID=2283527 RepID=UPI000E4352B1|nr:hypothetical protein [Haloprofundus halophilus]